MQNARKEVCKITLTAGLPSWPLISHSSLGSGFFSSLALALGSAPAKRALTGHQQLKTSATFCTLGPEPKLYPPFSGPCLVQWLWPLVSSEHPLSLVPLGWLVSIKTLSLLEGEWTKVLKTGSDVWVIPWTFKGRNQGPGKVSDSREIPECSVTWSLPSPAPHYP